MLWVGAGWVPWSVSQRQAIDVLIPAGLSYCGPWLVFWLVFNLILTLCYSWNLTYRLPPPLGHNSVNHWALAGLISNRKHTTIEVWQSNDNSINITRSLQMTWLWRNREIAITKSRTMMRWWCKPACVWLRIPDKEKIKRSKESASYEWAGYRKLGFSTLWKP